MSYSNLISGLPQDLLTYFPAAAKQVFSAVRAPDNKAASTSALIITMVAGLLTWEQFAYRRKKKGLPGPKWKIPVIGALMDSLRPTFEAYLEKWNSGELSCVSVLDRFIVIASTRDLSRKILSGVGTEPLVVDAMHKVLEPENWVFLSGKEHVDYRRALNVLFTRRALGIYLPIQSKVYTKHFEKWLSLGGKPQPFQMYFRDINMEVSLRVFCGTYISEEAARKISDDYYLITAALELVNLPWSRKIANAIKAKEYIVSVFRDAIKASRERMARGEEQLCMLDAWVTAIQSSAPGKANGVGKENGSTPGKPSVVQYSDHEIALVLLTFLFASQDATTSGMTWAFQLVADHPEVLARIREEQIAVRNGDFSSPLTIDVIDKMTYLRQVVKEVLRLRPPVLMVPCRATKDLKLTPEYTAPQGSMVISTFWHALHDPEAYPDPHEFNPDRWGPQGTAESHNKNFLVFGYGPHACLGKEYAMMHLASCLAHASVKLNWEHVVTPSSEKIRIFATTYPEDGCILKVTPWSP